MTSPHLNHGRGDSESGPDDSGCPCTGKPEELACADAGCGFCVAATMPKPTPTPVAPDGERGVYRKFKVERSDGSSKEGGKHARCRYFVLDLDHDPHAAAALWAYAESCKEAFPDLACDLEYAAERLEAERLPEDGVDLGFKPGHIWGEDQWGKRG